MNKKGIIILLYSVALIAVLAVILLATVTPKSFTVNIGQAHAEIVKFTEIAQNFNSYTEDAALIAYEKSVCGENSNSDFESDFEREFERIMDTYPIFDDTSEEYKFSSRVELMNYNYEYGDGTVTIIGIPERIDTFDISINENNEFIIVDEVETGYYDIYSSIFEAKIYPNFELTESC